MFQGTNIIEFFQSFPDDYSCLAYLAESKLSDGFKCKKCGHTTHCRSSKSFVRKCTKCKYKESATAGTLFHKVKFPLQKAFYIVFMMSTSKKSCSAEEYARKLGIQVNTALLFQQKVRHAMKSRKKHAIKTKAVVDEFVVGGPEKNKKGRSKGRRKEVVMAIELNKFGILRTYCKHIKGAGSKELRPFFEDYIDKKTEVKTDGWRGYIPLSKTYSITQIPSNKGKNFPMIHRQIMMLKGWLRGVHHHCKYIQSYLDEFCYRFNRLRYINNIFDNLIQRMVETPKITKRQLIKLWGN